MTREEARDILVLMGASTTMGILNKLGQRAGDRAREQLGIGADVNENARAFGRSVLQEYRDINDITVNEIEKGIDNLQEQVVEALNTLFHKEGDSGLDVRH